MNSSHSTPRAVALVPIKLNNQRVPGKNLKITADGQPLMAHLIRTLASSDSIDRVYVFCSDLAVSSLTEQLGATFLQRSKSLDTDQTTSNDILRAFINQVDSDIYVLAHATSPFVSRHSLDAGVSAVRSGRHDSALSVNRVCNFYWQNGRPINYDPTRIPRTQDLEPLYFETSGFFVFRKDVFVEHGQRVGFRPKLIEVSNIEALDVDDPEDFSIVDALIEHRSRLS